MMGFQWKSFCQKRRAALSSDSGSNRSSRIAVSKELRRGSTSFWTAVYDKTVRTDSYNEFVMRMEMLAGDFLPQNGTGEVYPRQESDGLLKPNQETVEAVLRESNDKEGPEMMKMATDYFDSSRKASRLCGALLQSIYEARVQCRQMEETLAGMPRSGEALGFLQQTRMAEGLFEMAEAKDPFSETEANRMFEDVRESYGVLSSEVEESRKAIGRRVRVLKRWKGGCIVAIAVAVVAGVTLIAVVVATHAVASVAGVPVAVAAAKVRGRALTAERGQKASICYRLGLLRRQSAKLEALARGSFTVNRMLDTLRCLALGLHEDVERNRRLVEFGWTHREEGLCVQQVAKQLCRSQLHLVQQLDNLEEQVVVCFLIINKTRDWVLQEFST